MKTYQDLNLKQIRETLNIDFAHYTYQGKQCSCCYGPQDLPKLYRRKGIEADEIDTYILFKNASNGRGTVTKHDQISNYTNISWNLNEEQLEGVCKMLQEQLGEEYVVVKPENPRTCIEIQYKSNYVE